MELLDRARLRKSSVLVHWARCLAAVLIAAHLALCASPVHATSPTTYVVQPGDTLSLIARRYDTTVQAIAERNNIPNPNLIYVSQRLIIPSDYDDSTPVAQIHLVQSGETLSRIAQRYGTTVSVVVAANRIADPSLILVGQRLAVPGATASAPLPSPFVSVKLEPPSAIQGQTVAIKVQTDEPVDLAGSLDGRPLIFVGESNSYWSLAGIGASAPLGPYLLELTASDDAGQTTSASELVYIAAGDFITEQIILSPAKGKLLDPALTRAETQRVNQIVGIFDRQRRWEGLFRVPLQGAVRITSAFGTRRSYNGGTPTSYHGGVDYGAEAGTPVLAAGGGRVVLAEELIVRGNAVIIHHGWGVYSGYYHLSEIEVEAGQAVKRGDAIGKVGSSGLSTGAHLHWEIRVSGVYVAPLQWTRHAFP